jgi:hypothetical protein
MNYINNNYSKISMKYECKSCDYTTNYLQNYNKHCTTLKHLEQNTSYSIYKCSSCSKLYKYKSGLSRHKKRCVVNTDIIQSKQRNQYTIENNTSNYINDNNNDFKDIVYQLMNENRELQNKLVEIANIPKIVNNNQTITCNKNFNIINFLNTDCKDAFNLSEFIENLNVTFGDLHYIKEHGYLQGIKDSLVKSLSELAQDKRPIHCTDLKRKCFYVKKNDTWDKDQTCKELNAAINTFNHEQLRKIVEWKKTNPNEEEFEDTLNIITKEITTMYQEQGNKLRTKILNEIGNATIIYK